MSANDTEPTETREPGRKTRVDPYLFLVCEGRRLDAGGLRVSLAGPGPLRIGRGEARSLARSKAGVALSVPDPKMSAGHAQVLSRGSGFAVEDAGSTNGTIVNGSPLPPGEPRALRDGDVVELGQTVFLYRELEVDASIPARDLIPDPASFASGTATLDPELARRLGLLTRIAAAPLSVLLLGETGTGKEVLARAVHAASRRPGPFVAVNCGAIPANLVESQLFGHVKGSFSGATGDQPGMVRAASHGTLLLDEIGDLPPSSQAALLRTLQESEVVPVGSSQAVKVDVRVIAATHKPLESLIETGAFRRDLYARLSGYSFSLPPLRARRFDLGVLIASMLAKGALWAPSGLRLHREAVRAMLRHDWPMNVRELVQCLSAAGALAEDGVVTADLLPEALAWANEPKEAPLDDDDEKLRAELVERFAEAKGNLSEVARAMGKARQQVQRWARRFGIDPEKFRR